MEKETIDAIKGKKVHTISIILLLAAFAFITYMSLIKGVSVQVTSDLSFSLNSGGIMHFLAYFTLASLFFLSFYGKGLFSEISMKSNLVKSALIVGAYGILIEFIQLFMPLRAFQLSDMLMNMIGAFMIIPVYYFIDKKFNKNEKI